MFEKVTNIFTRPKSTNTDKFSLNGFTSEMNKSGLARPAYFGVIITPPPKLVEYFPEISRSLRLRVDTAELPMRGLMTHDQMYYGPRRMIPYGFMPAPITLTVLLSEDYRERQFFMAWQDLFLGKWRTERGSTVPRAFDSHYYNNAVDGASVELLAYATTPKAQAPTNTPARTLFGEAQEIARAVGFDPSIVTDPFGLNLFGAAAEREIAHSLSVKLVEPYPFDVAAVPMNWGEDGFGKLSVTIQYRYFTEEHRTFKTDDTDQSLARMLRDGVNAFNRFRPLFSVVRGQGIGGAVRASTGQVTGGARNVGRSVTTF